MRAPPIVFSTLSLSLRNVLLFNLSFSYASSVCEYVIIILSRKASGVFLEMIHEIHLLQICFFLLFACFLFFFYPPQKTDKAKTFCSFLIWKEKKLKKKILYHKKYAVYILYYYYITVPDRARSPPPPVASRSRFIFFFFPLVICFISFVCFLFYTLLPPHHFRFIIGCVSCVGGVCRFVRSCVLLEIYCSEF